MTIQNKIFMMLLTLSLLMGAGILIPGYLKMRGIELNEAIEYTRDRSIGMREELERAASVLKKAGVGDIQSYVDSSKAGIVDRYRLAQPDVRINKIILDSNGKIIFAEHNVIPMPITSGLMAQMRQTEKGSELRYESGKDRWLVSFEQHEEWGWFLLVSMPNEEVYRNSLAYLIYVLSISAPVFLFVIGLYVLLSRQLRRKITLIMDYLALYKDGQYEKRIPSSVPDEISVLQIGINTMIDSIEMEILSRKSIEEELNASKLQAEQANREKTAFLECVSNEIKEPMNSIIGYSKLLSNTKLNRKQIAYTNSLLHVSQNLTILINDALSFTKLSDDFNKSNYSFFDLAQVMSSAFDRFAQAGKQKGIQLKLTIGDSIPPLVFGDKARCTQIITNLVHNSVKFTSEGGVDLRIELDEESDSQYIVRFELIDTGIGMSKPVQEKFLEASIQLSTPSNSNAKGLGLGLAIVKGFLDSMDGTIGIESKDGQGTKITIMIPFDKNQAGHPKDTSLIDSIKDITVLAVDDNEYYRQFIKETFRDVDIKCIVVESGKEVIDCLEEEDIDLILMDMRLPNKGSEAAIKTIQGELPTYLRDIPIVAVTANVYEKDIGRYSSLNVAAHIAKPFEAATLFSLIGRVLDES